MRAALAAAAAGGARAAAAGARLVLNHSTHLETLIPALRSLCASPLLSTVVPGRLAATGGRPAAGLSLRLGVATASGYKLTARRGGGVQEVFVVVQPGVTVEQLRGELRRLLPGETAAMA